MTEKNIVETLDLHAKWLRQETGGKMVNFRWANLRGADLRETDLRKLDFHGADLRGANLYGADLRETNFRESDISAANLQEVKLGRTNFRETAISGARFSKGVKIVSFSDIRFSCPMTTFRVDTNEVWHGDFWGTLEEFTAKIEEKLKENPQYLRDYRTVVAMFNGMKETI